MKIVYCRPGHVGWSSVTRMVHLLAELFDAELEQIDGDGSVSRRRQAARRLPRPRAVARGTLLLVAPLPEHLNSILRPSHFFRGYDRIAAWVIDSFRDETIPDVARALGHFDHLFLGDAEVLETWHKVTRTPVSWVPFGTDALSAHWDGARTVDIQRIGRQPASWDDDRSNRLACERRGISYAGSAPFAETHEANGRQLDAAMGRAKLTLSFSNTAAPDANTHPRLQYLTARWLDALAHGAVVAGVAPRCEASRRLLCQGATLDLSSTDREAGLDMVEAWLQRWSPAVARASHLHSLEHTDWRWRFREVAETLDIRPEALERDLATLAHRIRLVQLGG